jgi:type II secretory pathway component PulC
LLIVLGVVVLLAIYTFIIRKHPNAMNRVNQVKANVNEKITAAKNQIKKEVPSQVNNIAKSVTEPSKKITQSLTSKPQTSVVMTDTYKFTMGVDPFVRDWVISGQVTDLKLKAITQSGDKAYALINDQILEVGEAISGKKIVAIEKDKVVLEQEGKTFSLLLGQ